MKDMEDKFNKDMENLRKKESSRNSGNENFLKQIKNTGEATPAI
jgi:hypothetical protein